MIAILLFFPKKTLCNISYGSNLFVYL